MEFVLALFILVFLVILLVSNGRHTRRLSKAEIERRWSDYDAQTPNPFDSAEL